MGKMPDVKTDEKVKGNFDEQFTEKDIEKIFGGKAVHNESDGTDHLKYADTYTAASDNLS